jgi:hypothetical protein
LELHSAASILHGDAFLLAPTLNGAELGEAEELVRRGGGVLVQPGGRAKYVVEPMVRLALG